MNDTLRLPSMTTGPCPVCRDNPYMVLGTCPGCQGQGIITYPAHAAPPHPWDLLGCPQCHGANVCPHCQGRSIGLSKRHHDYCAACEGKGTCPHCGAGHIQAPLREQRMQSALADCPICWGMAYCPICLGTGWIPKDMRAAIDAHCAMLPKQMPREAIERYILQWLPTIAQSPQICLEAPDPHLLDTDPPGQPLDAALLHHPQGVQSESALTNHVRVMPGEQRGNYHIYTCHKEAQPQSWHCVLKDATATEVLAFDRQYISQHTPSLWLPIPQSGSLAP